MGMPRITLDVARVGDILETDVMVNEVVLFPAGIDLTKERLDILDAVGVKVITIEERYRSSGDQEKILKGVEDRFSYVHDMPLMANMESWVKDILSTRGGIQ
jgi:hypothetical protein